MAKGKEKTSALAAYKEFHDVLRSGNVPHVALLYGPEDFLIETAQHEAEKILVDAATRDFNYALLSGGDTDINVVMREVMSFPVMAERKVVVVRDFEKLRGTSGDDNPFLKYLENPSASTFLLLIAAKAEFNRHPFVALKKYAACYEFSELDERSIAAWLMSRAKNSSYAIESNAAEMLAALSSGSLRTAAQELDKLTVYLEGSKEKRITTREVELISCGDETYTIFALVDALGARNKKTAMTILEKMLGKGEEPLMMLAMISRYVSQLVRAQSLRMQSASQADAARSLGVPPFVVKKLIDASQARSQKNIVHALKALGNAELTLKSRPTDSRVVMTMLVQEIV